MLSLLTIAVLALAAQLTSAHPNPPPASPFQVTTLTTFEPSGRPNQENLYRVAFNVTDPADSSAAYCEAQWDYSVATTGYPSSYLANCTNTAYAFKFVNYNTYYDFVLDVRHKSKKHGKKVTRFGKGLVDFGIIQCTHAASGFSVCTQREGVAFPLNVYKVD